MKCIIVKLLGETIGYRALENILNQIWVMRGILNIVDIGYNYFLVTFMNEEDQNIALMEGLGSSMITI